MSTDPSDFLPICQAILEQWQTILRLRDWDVTLRLGKHHTLGPDTLGSIAADPYAKTADLFLLHPSDWAPSLLTSHALEGTIVHELLHLPCREAGIDYNDHEERLVHYLEKVFMDLGGAE